MRSRTKVLDIFSSAIIGNEQPDNTSNSLYWVYFEILSTNRVSFESLQSIKLFTLYTLCILLYTYNLRLSQSFLRKLTRSWSDRLESQSTDFLWVIRNYYGKSSVGFGSTGSSKQVRINGLMSLRKSKMKRSRLSILICLNTT